jgi:CBS domain containing-hemolysin-like protein
LTSSVRHGRKRPDTGSTARAAHARPESGGAHIARSAAACAVCAAIGLAAVNAIADSAPESGVVRVSGLRIFTPAEFAAGLTLLGFNAFFSASGIAYFSLHKLQLRSMGVTGGPRGRLVYRLMQRPGALLTTILMGSSITKALFAIVCAAPLGEYLQHGLQLPALAAYPAAIAATAAVLVFFGEVLPKVLAARYTETFARSASLPIFIIDRLLSPVRDSLMAFTGLIFRVTRFSEMQPAPFITDDEFMSLLSEGEAAGVIEKDEREMIAGILEFSDVMVREILVPRPDMLALQAEATAAEALALISERQLSRIPVYGGSLDEIVGMLYAKDLLYLAEDGRLNVTVRQAARKPHFVPETMRVADFVRTAQRTRTHMAIVVDEFGGTKGLVTLEDALREVVGAIEETPEEQAHPLVQVGEREYEADGGVLLDDLEESIGLRLDTPVHMTVAGFVIEQQERLPEAGDVVEHEGVRFHVLEMDGRRVARMRITLPEPVSEVITESADSGEVHAT